jgi:hypothetical protein
MAVHGHMDLSSYDQLFPAQDVVPTGGVGNLIAAPLQVQPSQVTTYEQKPAINPREPTPHSAHQHRPIHHRARRLHPR